ncbi:MAG: helix-turn-helix domain-containing protein [Paramuribaculum sp.]|nr:helix-turn-helix domain-containing protein [Paramuribaculum sp.]
MKTNITSYNNLPERIDEILSELSAIRVLLEKVSKPEQIPKFLNIDDAVTFLQSQGIRISKSTLYKRSASGILPIHKIDNKIYFNPQDLINVLTDGNK